MTSPRLPWQRAWHEALYSPDGFYRDRRDQKTHFTTSVMNLPAGPAVMARAMIALARRHQLSTVVDIGAHQGALAAALHREGSTLRYIGVDVVQPSHPVEGVDEWIVSPGGAGLPEDLTRLTGALVIAHEWLDVVPAVVASATSDSRWHEVWVDPRTGNEELGPPVSDDDQEWLERWVGADVRLAEVGRARDQAFADLASRVEQGLVVVIDYGHVQQTRPLHGTLRGYRDGRRVRAVPDGSMDLTADVTIDSLVAAAAGPCWNGSQAEALNDLLGSIDQPAHALAHQDPAAYLDGWAEAAAYRTLCDPASFGAFHWVVLDRTRVG